MALFLNSDTYLFNNLIYDYLKPIERAKALNISLSPVPLGLV